MKHLCVLYTNLNLTKTQDKEKNEKPQYHRGNNRRRSEMS